MIRWRKPTVWRIVHEDYRKQVLTIERDRRFFRGRYRIVTCESVHMYVSGNRITMTCIR